VTAASGSAGTDVLRHVTLMTFVERPSNRSSCNHRITHRWSL